MIDAKGLYVQADGDGGDCAHRTGTMLACMGLLGQAEEYGVIKLTTRILEQLTTEAYQYRRHWDTAKFWPDGKQIADPKHFSRDQASRIILGYATTGDKFLIWDWLGMQAQRFFFHQNGDIMTPGEWANIIRGLNLWFLWPLLWILDLKFIGDCYFRTKQKWDYDTLMLPDLAFALKKFPTWPAEIARRIYKKSDYLESVLNNHRLENNGCVELLPPLLLVAKKFIEKEK